MGIPHFVNSYFSWWPLDCFYFLAIMSSASVNTLVQIFAWTYVSSLLLGVELLGHMVTQCLSFWGPTKLFFQSTPFYVITSSVWEFPFPDILTNTWYCQCFLTHPSGMSDFTFTFHFHALEKEMATHSSVLAWRISGTGEPGGLPSMGSHRVRHDWRDTAAAVGYDVASHCFHMHCLYD